MSHLYLHLLLGRPITMPNHGHNTTKLHHLSERCRYDWRIVQLKWHRPRNVQSRCQLPQYHISQYLGTIIIVLVRVLHKTKTIYVAHKRFAIGTQQIESAHGLLEGQTHFARDQLFGIAQDNRITDLFAFAVAFDFAIECWALPGLGVRIIWSDGVHLDIGACGHRGFDLGRAGGGGGSEKKERERDGGDWWAEEREREMC